MTYEKMSDADKAIARIWKALGIKTYAEAGGKEISQIVADMKTALASAIEDRDRVAETLANSEMYRRAYQRGKYAMYAEQGEVAEAAMRLLPCGEGALDRRFTRMIEMPRIRAIEAELDAAIERAEVAERALQLATQARNDWASTEDMDPEDYLADAEVELAAERERESE